MTAAFLAHESGTIKESVISDGTGIVLTMLEREPLTFGELVSSFGEGSPFRNTHTLSIILKRLREDGRIASIEVKLDSGYVSNEYHAVDGFVERVGVKARKVGRGLWDSLKYKITNEPWSDKYETPEVVERTAPQTAAYFAYHTFKRAEKSDTRKSGWKVTPSEFEWGQNFVSASKETVFGDAGVGLSLYNARKVEWYDEWTMKGNFKRASQEELRIPRNKHLRYLQRAVEDIVPKAYQRTQMGEMAADVVLWHAHGDANKAHGIVSEALGLGESPEVKALYNIIGAEQLNLNTKEDRMRLQQHLLYVSHRINEKTSRVVRPTYA